MNTENTENTVAVQDTRDELIDKLLARNGELRAACVIARDDLASISNPHPLVTAALRILSEGLARR